MTSPESLYATGSSEWYTPTSIIDAARMCLGHIDLDPASCVAANRHVGASGIFTTEHESTDGLATDNAWHGNVFLNPPSPPRPWWDRLIAEHTARRVSEAIYVAYSIESLQQSQGWAAPMLAFPVCFPSKRLRYLTTASDLLQKAGASLGKARAKLAQLEETTDEEDFEADPGILVALKTAGSAVRTLEKRVIKLSTLPPDSLHPGDAPPHASAIVGVGVDVQLFTLAFSDIGAVVVPARTDRLQGAA